MSLDPLVELPFPVARIVTAMFASIQRPLGPGSEPMEAINGRVERHAIPKPTAHARKLDLCPLHFDLRVNRHLWCVLVRFGDAKREAVRKILNIGLVLFLL